MGMVSVGVLKKLLKPFLLFIFTFVFSGRMNSVFVD